MNPPWAGPGARVRGEADPATLAPLIYPLPSLLDRLDLAALFPTARPLEVELGSGDGTFLVDYAGLHPERNFLGVERLLGRLRKIDRKGRRAALTNLRAVRIEARYFVEYLLPPASVSAIHLYFPDPWPKRKHHRHRLVNPHFVGVAWRALTADGVVYVRTDDADYFAWIQDVFGADSRFQPADTPPGLRLVLTDFEREFLAQGTPTRYAAYQRR
jgi:tRNA (guanine-N7-)-methyltransferase